MVPPLPRCPAIQVEAAEQQQRNIGEVFTNEPIVQPKCYKSRSLREARSTLHDFCRRGQFTATQVVRCGLRLQGPGLPWSRRAGTPACWRSNRADGCFNEQSSWS